MLFLLEDHGCFGLAIELVAPFVISSRDRFTVACCAPDSRGA